MATSPNETCLWLGLYLIPGLGNAAFRNLIECFGSAREILRADLKELVCVKGLRREVAHRIAGRQFAEDPELELRKVEKAGGRVLIYTDAAYPAPLREIPHPPMVLYVRGKPLSWSDPMVAIVGSRNATHYGRKTAHRLGRGLAHRGIGVVSGLARGIDSAAHAGCLAGDGLTVAVLGTGIDRVYPFENKRLFDRILETGVVISEFPMGSPPEPRNFPIRNRIISGLSRGVAVVEASKKSGSLITASLALSQGREVFAVPGSIDSFKSAGTHYLIKQGAKLVENVDDILEEIGLEGSPGEPSGRRTNDSTGNIPMDESESKVYEVMGEYPMHMDEIVRVSGMGAEQVSSVLMRMELKGLVRQLPGKIFVR